MGREQTAKAIQSHFTALAHNPLLLAPQKLESRHHPRDTKEKYERWMGRRKAAARQLARTLDGLVQSVRRSSEHSLRILPWPRHPLRACGTLKASPACFFSSI